MASASVLARLQIEFKHDRDALARCVALLEDGAPAAFLARYRRPETGGLDESAILALSARLEQLVEVERRRATILRSLEQLGRCTPALRARLETTFDRAKLEDLYRPHRPKKKTRCAQALAAGLAPLAEAVATGTVSETELGERAAAATKPEAGFPDAASVLDGVAHIIGEWVADDPYVRQHVRDVLRKRGRLRVHPIEGAKGAERHRAVAQIDEPLLRVAPHRYLLVRRGEREKALRAEIAMDPEEILTWIDARYLDGARAANPRRRGARKGARGAANEGDASQADGAAEQDESSREAEEHGEMPHGDAAAPEAPIDEGRFDGFREAPYEVEVPGDEPPTDGAEAAAESAGDGDGADAEEHPAEDEPANDEPSEAESAAPAGAEDHVDAIPAPPHPAAPAAPLQGEVRALVRTAIRSAFTRWILGSCEEDVRLDMKQRCEQEILRGYQRSLRSLLLAPCAGRVVVLGFDPAARGAWRYAIADAAGAFVAEGAVQAGTEDAAVASREALFKDLEQHAVRMIAVGNGETSRKIARAVRGWLAEKGSRVPLAITVEAGAGEYAASARGRAEHAQLDPAVRAALGMARRAQDPLAEVAKADWRHLGLGPLQSEVGKGRLQRALEETMRTVVAQVGVDLATAPAALLQYVPGLDAEKARAIAAEREKRGGFRRRRDLLEVAGVDAATCAYAEGFLRLEGGEDPLDRTHLIEEHRPLAEALANAVGRPLAEIVGQRGALASVDLAAIAATLPNPDGPTLDRLDNVRRELEHLARDTRARRRWPRAEFVPAAGTALEAGQEIEGVCTNVTSFGIFLDLGLEQDGLVHITELGGRFVRHPQDLAHVGDVLRARVVQVDGERGRVALTLRPAQREHAPRREGRPPRAEGQEGRPPRAPRGDAREGGSSERPQTGARPAGGERPPRGDRQERGERRDRREPEGNVRAAATRRDGLGGGRSEGRGGGGRGRGGPGGERGGFSRGGPRGGARGEGRGDDDRRGGGRGEREDFGAAAKPPRARDLGWNPFRSFFGKGEAAADEAAPSSKPTAGSAGAERAEKPAAKPEATPPPKGEAADGIPPLVVDDGGSGSF
ncbi:MAG: helix-hairpin-helix domain-containing protein [Planctomycetes bacterium]|nr:helix-hairpin-helix domain-containing protein [Planctomycetota bacterium]